MGEERETLSLDESRLRARTSLTMKERAEVGGVKSI